MSNRRIWACCFMLLVMLIAQRRIASYVDQYHENNRPVRLKRQLQDFPVRLGPWVGYDVPISDEILQVSNADDYLNRVYERTTADGTVHRVKVWANYSVGRGSLQHIPVHCMPGAGYSEVDSKDRPVIRGSSEDGAEFQAVRLTFEKDHEQELVFYWWYSLDSTDQISEVAGRLSRYTQGFLRVQNSSGLVVSTYVPAETDPDGRLTQDLVGRLTQELWQEFLPPGSRAHAAMPSIYGF